MTKEEVAKKLYKEVKEKQLEDFRNRMPDEKQGVEFEQNGIKYVAAIRRLTPLECDRLQGVPEWYNWDGISDSQHYKMDGNGWQVDTIKHIWSFLPKFNRPIRVWSLFDGMSCASITLKELNIPVEAFISSEVDKFAIAVEKQNFPNMIQVGSVTDINVQELIDKYGIPDFLCGGSPCQSFSFSGKMKGMATKQGEEIYTLEKYLELKREGFQFEGQSYLFWEYMRILKELQKVNPDIYFFLENVVMLEKWERCLSHAIGVRGVHINSALVSAQQRKRIYWSNIKVKEIGTYTLFDEESNNPFDWPNKETDIPQPKDKGIVIKDILQHEADDKFYLKDEVVGKLIEKTDKAKLKDYLLQPQVTIEEALEYMNNHDGYASYSNEEKCELAAIGYEIEKKRLNDAYYS